MFTLFLQKSPFPSLSFLCRPQKLSFCVSACPFSTEGFNLLHTIKNLNSLNYVGHQGLNIVTGSAKKTKTQQIIELFLTPLYVYVYIEIVLVRFLLSSPHPPAPPPFSLFPLSSPHRPCCAVSSNFVCQALVLVLSPPLWWQKTQA